MPLCWGHQAINKRAVLGQLVTRAMGNLLPVLGTATEAISKANNSVFFPLLVWIGTYLFIFTENPDHLFFFKLKLVLELSP